LGGAPAFVHGSQLTTRIAGWGVQVLLRKSG
jgi:hypothetical protein